MKTLITTVIATFAFAATASAGETTFKTSFAYDANAPVSETYNSFKTDVKTVCAKELLLAGFRPTESASYERRKCERQLMSQAVKASKNTTLIAYHKNGGKLQTATRKYASNK